MWHCMVFLKCRKNFPRVSEVLKYKGKDGSYETNGGNGPHSGWRWRKVLLPLKVIACFGRARSTLWVFVKWGLWLSHCPKPGFCTDFLKDGSWFSFPVSHLPSSAKRTAISSRKAIPCDSDKANLAIGLACQNTQLPSSYDQSNQSPRLYCPQCLPAGLEKKPVQELERNVEPWSHF